MGLHCKYDRIILFEVLKLVQHWHKFSTVWRQVSLHCADTCSASTHTRSRTLTWICQLWALWRSSWGSCHSAAQRACWCSGTRSDWTGWWRLRDAAVAGRRRQQLGPPEQPGPTFRRCCCCCNTQTELLLATLSKRHELNHTQHKIVAYCVWGCSLLLLL